MEPVEGYALPWISVKQEVSAADVAALVPLYSAVLFRVAYSVLRNRPESEDVVQDTFVRVLQHRHKLAEIEKPRVWLIRIAWNLALDRQRKLKADQMEDFVAETLSSSDHSAEERLHEARVLRSALTTIDTLPVKERRVLLLSALEELSTAEIAAMEGRSESSIRAILFRARTRLRDRLNRKETPR